MDFNLNANTIHLRKTFMLDVLRGLAALYVLIGHSKWLLWEGYTEGYKTHPEVYSFIDKIQMYTFSSFAFGHEAVMLFFVLSGFVIHYSSYNQYLKSGTFNIGNYLFKRIKRIYPPFIFALILTFILDRIGASFGYSIYYGTTDFDVMNRNIVSDLSIETLLGNLCMLQGMYTPVWGTNGPVWSLMYEWWFYILYIPIFYTNKRSPVFTTALAGVTLLAAIFIPIETYKFMKVFQYFFAWYLGVVLADFYLGRIIGIKSQVSIVLFTIVFIISISIWTDFKRISDYYVALFFVLLIFASIKYFEKLKRFYVLQPLADFSYTLYVIHMPILIIMSGWLQHTNNGALPMHFGYVYLALIICLFSAWLIHYIVERPFVRKK